MSTKWVKGIFFCFASNASRSNFWARDPILTPFRGFSFAKFSHGTIYSDSDHGSVDPQCFLSCVVSLRFFFEHIVLSRYFYACLPLLRGTPFSSVNSSIRDCLVMVFSNNSMRSRIVRIRGVKSRDNTPWWLQRWFFFSKNDRLLSGVFNSLCRYRSRLFLRSKILLKSNTKFCPIPAGRPTGSIRHNSTWSPFWSRGPKSDTYIDSIQDYYILHQRIAMKTFTGIILFFRYIVDCYSSTVDLLV